ncbi:MAG TPA: TolC family protein [Candidatus Sulfotelmatobacter sp.]|nr:TolC family protein [Candidatus Sulfotelmatobacter sp.]
MRGWCVISLTIALFLVAAPIRCQESAATGTAPAEAEVLTLDQAIAAALANNRQIKIFDQNVLISNDEILAARTQRYPHFSVDVTGSGLLTPVTIKFPTGVFGLVGTTPIPSRPSEITTDPKFSALSIIQAYQPLTQLYSAHLNLELLGVGKKLSQEQLRQQKQQITSSVKQAYYQLLQSQSALEAADENVKALREVDRTTQEYVQQKAALPYQGASVKVQLAQAELQQVTLQDTIQTQKENLNNLMGRDLATDFRLGAVPDALPEEENIDLARQNALTGRTEIRQAQFKIEQATYAKRLQKAQYIPEVGIRYLFFSPFTADGLPRYVNSLGINFKWDVYDWGYKKHLTDEKQRQIEQSQLNLTETSSQVVLDVSSRFRKLREARASLNVAQLAQDAEKQKLQVVLEQFKQKATLLGNLQAEQANMAQASAQYQQALSNFWNARADFEKAMGTD